MMQTKHVTIIFFLVNLTLVSQPVFGQPDKYQPEIPLNHVRMMESGRTLRRDGNNKDAVKKLTSLLKLEPNYYLAHYNLAISYLNLGENDLSKDAFSKALLLKENLKLPDATIYNSFGWSYLIQGKYDEAKELFLKGIQNQEQLSRKSKGKLFHNLGLLYTYEGELELGKKFLSQAVEQGNTLASGTLTQLKLLQQKTTSERLGDTKKAKKPYYLIVGSFDSLNDAKKHAEQLKMKTGGRELQVRLAENGYYSVNLGNPVNYGDGSALANFAKESGIARDAYLYTVEAFGDVLFSIK